MTKDHPQKSNDFYTPEQYAKSQVHRMESTRGHLIIAACRTGSFLADKMVNRYNELLHAAGSQEQVLYLKDIDKNFTDSETCVRLEEHISGYDVFLVQALYDPTSERSVDQNYMAFLIAARTLREHGAKHVTGVLPYLAYARQDKPTKFKREPTTAKLLADLSVEAGIDRLIGWNPHSQQLHGFYGKTPVNLLSPLTLFEQEFQRFQNQENVIAVSPDVGASKLITHFGRNMGINSAITSKFRPKPEKVEMTEIIGDFDGKRIAIILDDILGSGGTIVSAVKQLVHSKNINEVYVGISHNVGVDNARERLIDLHENYHLKELIITDSIPQPEDFWSLSFVKICSLADILSRTINRIHYNRSVSQIFYQ